MLVPPGMGKMDTGSQSQISGSLPVKEMERILLRPHISAATRDAVFTRCGVKRCGTRVQWTANVGLTFEFTQRCRRRSHQRGQNHASGNGGEPPPPGPKSFKPNPALAMSQGRMKLNHDTSFLSPKVS
jgi:hypothetical protein